MATLECSLQANQDLRGHFLFYFTNNLVTHHISHSGSSPSPDLHKLAQQLKLLELQVGCQLEVTHVPCTTKPYSYG